MSAADWILLALIGAYVLWLLFRPKKKHCSGSCDSCPGCHS